VGPVRDLTLELPEPASVAEPTPAQSLLERHRPLFRFDRQYDYRAAAVEGAIENAGNLLRSRHGEVVARAGGDPELTLALLRAYPDGGSSHERDCICLGSDPLGDARRMEGEDRYAGRVYGRVVEDGGRTWLQYWFWLYYNPKNLFGFGKHEGDWEMVQFGLGDGGEVELATYAQHDTGEARGRDEIEWVERDGGLHPVLYVAPLSHASYFEPGTHPYPVGIDHPYGDGPAGLLPVVPFGDWVEWPGRWGNSERVIANRIGNGPPSPSRQGPKWDRPASFHKRIRRRRLRSLLGRALHFAGGATYPRPPAIRARLDGRVCTVSYRLDSSFWRRSAHLYLTVHDGDRVIASRTVRGADPSGAEVLRLPSVPAAPAVWGSTFNGLRQRSDLSRAELT
jgi:hypothetical protein